MFEARFFAVRAATALDEDAQDSDDDFIYFTGRDDHTKVASEGFMTRRASESDAENNFITEARGLDADIVGVFDRADQATAVEGDVEFAGKVVERTVVDDD